MSVVNNIVPSAKALGIVTHPSNACISIDLNPLSSHNLKYHRLDKNYQHSNVDQLALLNQILNFQAI